MYIILYGPSYLYFLTIEVLHRSLIPFQAQIGYILYMANYVQSVKVKTK